MSRLGFWSVAFHFCALACEPDGGLKTRLSPAHEAESLQSFTAMVDQQITHISNSKTRLACVPPLLREAAASRKHVFVHFGDDTSFCK